MYLSLVNIPEYPELKKEMPINIPYKTRNRIRKLKDFADIIYPGYRCKLIHESFIKYGIISVEQKELIKWNEKSKKVVLNPFILFDKLKEYFEDYLKKLNKDPTGEKMNHIEEYYKKVLS